jgi:hypothetical protein
LKLLGNILFVDVTFEKYADYSKAKIIIRDNGRILKVLGEYKTQDHDYNRKEAR